MLKSVSIAFAISLFAAPAFVPTTAEAGNGRHSFQRSFQTQANRTCTRLWRQARRRIRDEARRHCVSRHGSSGVRRVRGVRFARGQCSRGSQRSTVTGTLSFRSQ